jgi:hypothetical protein
MQLFEDLSMPPSLPLKTIDDRPNLGINAQEGLPFQALGWNRSRQSRTVLRLT